MYVCMYIHARMRQNAQAGVAPEPHGPCATCGVCSKTTHVLFMHMSGEEGRRLRLMVRRGRGCVVGSTFGPLGFISRVLCSGSSL